MRNVDPRLWAMLRIIYTDNESDLLKHGYNPKLLQQPGSLIAADREVNDSFYYVLIKHHFKNKIRRMLFAH